MSLTIGIGEKEEKGPTHVDDFIYYGTDINPDKRSENEDYARWVLMHARLPAITKLAFDKFMKEHKLFCVHEGKTYRVTGASRLGDVWLTSDFSRDAGYERRVNVDDCSGWSREP